MRHRLPVLVLLGVRLILSSLCVLRVLGGSYFGLNCTPGPNYPPNPPDAPRGPSIGKKNTAYTFSSRAFDREQDSLRLQFIWGDGTHTNWGRFVSSGAYDSAAKSWSHAGQYGVRVRARDAHGETSDSSDILSISILDSLPNNSPLVPAAPTGPGAGLHDSSYVFEAVSFDPDGDDIAYQFDWDDTTSLVWTGLVPSGTPVQLAHQWTLADTFLVQCRVKDRKGLVSDWSEGHEIVITEGKGRR